MKAIWNNTVIADSNDVIVVENNHYFAKASVHMEYLHKSGNQYTCTWKGVCDYYTIRVNGKENPDSAWIYETPTEPVKAIAGRVAFWKGIEVTE